MNRIEERIQRMEDDRMQAWIIELTGRFGYFGILFLIFLENVFPPIPSEIILPFGGFLTTCTAMDVTGVVCFATIGSVLGAVVLYAVGACLNEERLNKVVNGKVGKLLHFKMEQIEKAILWFHRYGIWTVLFCRCIPIVRSLISIPAGMTGMKMGRFLVLTAIGSFIWNLTLVGLGAAAGASWGMISYYISMYGDIVKIIALGILASVAVSYLLRMKRQKEREA